jgi:hypothetical protein
MPDLHELSTLPDGWLDVPESMSDLWVRYGYLGRYLGCDEPPGCGSPSPTLPTPQEYYDYLGSYSPRITQFGMAENGEMALTVSGRQNDRIMVEVSVDQQSWQNSSFLFHNDEIHTLQVAGPDAPPVAQYRLRLLRPYDGWPHIPSWQDGGEE